MVPQTFLYQMIPVFCQKEFYLIFKKMFKPFFFLFRGIKTPHFSYLKSITIKMKLIDYYFNLLS